MNKAQAAMGEIFSAIYERSCDQSKEYTLHLAINRRHEDLYAHALEQGLGYELIDDFVLKLDVKLASRKFAEYVLVEVLRILYKYGYGVEYCYAWSPDICSELGLDH